MTRIIDRNPVTLIWILSWAIVAVLLGWAPW